MNSTNLEIIDHVKKLKLVYRNINFRCGDLTDPNYGAKGIKMCASWSGSFTKFLYWSLKNGYNPNLDIDRIDNSKGYFPSNCRFVDPFTQLVNRRPLIKNSHGEYAFEKKSDLPYNILNVFRGKKQKYKVEFSRKGRKYYIGEYFTVADAVSARDLALDQYDSGVLKIKGIPKKNLKNLSWILSDKFARTKK